MFHSRLLLVVANIALTTAHLGTLEHYQPDPSTTGSCGWQNNPNELVIALSKESMSNGFYARKNRKCGKQIEILNLENSRKVNAIVGDVSSKPHEHPLGTQVS